MRCFYVQDSTNVRKNKERVSKGSGLPSGKTGPKRRDWVQERTERNIGHPSGKAEFGKQRWRIRSHPSGQTG
jgi:hypothetical protein